MTIGLAILLGALALIVWLGYSVFTKRKVAFGRRQVLAWSQQEAASRVTERMLPVMQKWGYRLATQSPVATAFTCSYRPAWLAIPCVLLFPIGLLSLVYQRTVEITFAFVPTANGTELSVSGHAPPDLCDCIVEELTALAAPEGDGLRTNAEAR